MSLPEIEAFSCQVRPERALARVLPAGELDMLTTPEVERHLVQLHDAGWKHILLDLREVSFLDSTALHLLMRWTESSRADGFEFAVAPGAPQHRRILELTGLAGRLPIEADSGPAPV